MVQDKLSQISQLAQEAAAELPAELQAKYDIGFTEGAADSVSTNVEMVSWAASDANTKAFLATANCNQGQYLDVRSNNTVDLQTSAIYFEKLPGSQTIAASDPVNLSYTSTAGGSIGTSPTQQTFGTREFDSHGSWNGNTFTANISGVYSIDATVITAALTLSAAQQVIMDIYKNGSVLRTIGLTRGNTGTSVLYMINGHDILRLMAGETVSIYMQSSVATTQNTGSGNKIQIVRTGNY